jgi:hypothetical protein
LLLIFFASKQNKAKRDSFRFRFACLSENFASIFLLLFASQIFLFASFHFRVFLFRFDTFLFALFLLCIFLSASIFFCSLCSFLNFCVRFVSLPYLTTKYFSAYFRFVSFSSLFSFRFTSLFCFVSLHFLFVLHLKSTVSRQCETSETSKTDPSVLVRSETNFASVLLSFASNQKRMAHPTYTEGWFATPPPPPRFKGENPSAILDPEGGFFRRLM